MLNIRPCSSRKYCTLPDQCMALWANGESSHAYVWELSVAAVHILSFRTACR
jgi:hypothetical protein